VPPPPKLHTITRLFNKQSIEQNTTNGFLDADAMCAVGGKDRDWLRRQGTQPGTRLCDALGHVASEVRSNCTTKVVVFNGPSDKAICALVRTVLEGGGSGGDGRQRTWIHPLAAITLATLVSPALHVQTIAWTHRFLVPEPESGSKDERVEQKRRQLVESLQRDLKVALDGQSLIMEAMHSEQNSSREELLALTAELKEAECNQNVLMESLQTEQKHSEGLLDRLEVQGSEIARLRLGTSTPHAPGSDQGDGCVDRHRRLEELSSALVQWVSDSARRLNSNSLVLLAHGTPSTLGG
jgi:hypothetical protein